MKPPFLLRLIFNRYFFQKAVAIALFGFFAYALSDFLFVFLITFLFAYLFLDLSNWLSGKITHLSLKITNISLRNAIIRSNRTVVIVTGLYAVFIAIVIFIFSNLVPHVLEESKGIISEIPGIVDRVEHSVASLEGALKIDLGLKSAIASFFDNQAMEQAAKNVFENLRNLGIVFGKILIALILSYVFIVDRAKITGYLESVKRGNFAFLYDEYKIIFSKIAKGFGLIFKAQAFIALINAILTAISLVFIGLIHGGNAFPYVSTLAVMVFILGFVPVLGFIFSSIPLLIVGYNYGGHSVILMLAIMIAIVHSVEAYYLNPKIVSSYMEFPVFVTFLILLVSEHVFGFVGLLIGVPLFYILVDVAKDLDIFVNKVKRVSSTIDTTKTSMKDAIHKNIRLSRAQGQEEE